MTWNQAVATLSGGHGRYDVTLGMGDSRYERFCAAADYVLSQLRYPDRAGEPAAVWEWLYEGDWMGDESLEQVQTLLEGWIAEND